MTTKFVNIRHDTFLRQQVLSMYAERKVRLHAGEISTSKGAYTAFNSV